MALTQEQLAVELQALARDAERHAKDIETATEQMIQVQISGIEFQYEVVRELMDMAVALQTATDQLTKEQIAGEEQLTKEQIAHVSKLKVETQRSLHIGRIMLEHMGRRRALQTAFDNRMIVIKASDGMDQYTKWRVPKSHPRNLGTEGAGSQV